MGCVGVPRVWKQRPSHFQPSRPSVATGAACRARQRSHKGRFRTLWFRFLVHSSFLYAIVGWRPGGTFPFLQAQDEHVCIFGTMTAEKRPYGSLSADKVVLCLHSRKSARPAPLPPANSCGAHHHKVQKCPFRATSFRTVLAGNGVNYMGMTQTNSEGVYGCTSFL